MNEIKDIILQAAQRYAKALAALPPTYFHNSTLEQRAKKWQEFALLHYDQELGDDEARAFVKLAEYLLHSAPSLTAQEQNHQQR